MLLLLTELLHTLGNLLATAGNGVARLGRITAGFTAKSARAHFNLLGQYTAPIEQELFAVDEPPKPRDLNIIGQIALTLLPVNPLAWLLSVTLAPAVYNATLLLIVIYARLCNLALPDNPRLQLKIPEGSMPWYRQIYGAPGVVLALLAGLPSMAAIAFGRMLVNSWSSLKLGYRFIVNPLLDADQQITLDKSVQEDKGLNKYGFGLPGFLIGALAGFFVAGGIISWRLLKNSTLTAARIVFSAGFIVFNGEPAESGGVETDARSNFVKFGIGAPGTLIGALLAVPSMLASLAARVVYDSWLSVILTWTTLTERLHIDAELLDADHPKLDEGITGRNPLNKFFLGAPGLLIGSLAALFTSSVVVSGLILQNTWQTAVRLIYSAGFLAWHDQRAEAFGIEDDVNNQKRPLHHIFGYGLPGLVLGAPLAGLGMGIVALSRTFKQSTLTAARIVFSAGFIVFNGEPAENGGIETDARSNFVKFGIGAPGTLIGALLAVPSMLASLAARVVYDSWLSVILTWTTLTERLHIDAELLDADHPKLDEGITGRNPLNKFFLGAPGLLIGSLAALFTSSVVVSGLILQNTWQTAVRLIYSAGFLAWHDQRAEAFGIEDDVNNQKRPLHHIFGYGLPGLVLGAPLAALGMGIVALSRTFKQSTLTAARIVFSAGFIVFNGEPAKNGGIETDARSNFVKFGIGAPGTLIGALLAVPSMLASLAARVVYDSWLSVILTWTTLTERLHIDAELLKPEEITPLHEDITGRNPLNKFFLGAPGLLIGSLIALFTSSVVVSGLILQNTWQTAVRLIYSAGFLAWNDQRADAFGIEDDVNNQKRPLHHIFGYGLPGLVIGAPLAATGAALVVGFRAVKESLVAFAALSGSFLNGALGVPQFAGLAGDERSLSLKLVGTPGYLLAVLLTLPVSTLIFTGKFIAPSTVFFLVGAALSPVIAVIKWLNLGLGRARFEAATPSSDTEQRFMNLYSSLNGWGHLPESGIIQEQADGRKGPLCFSRKAVTLNVASLPERVLDDVLQAWRQSENKERFFEKGGEFDTAIQAIHAHYASLSCLEFRNTIDERTRHIDELGTFIKQYLQGESAPVPPRSQQGNSWSATFYGRPYSEEMPSRVLDNPAMAAASTVS